LRKFRYRGNVSPVVKRVGRKRFTRFILLPFSKGFWESLRLWVNGLDKTSWSVIILLSVFTMMLFVHALTTPVVKVSSTSVSAYVYGQQQWVAFESMVVFGLMYHTIVSLSWTFFAKKSQGRWRM
jgi:hypothetical protein